MKTLLKKISRLKVLVIGDIMLDGYIHGRVNRISPEAPIPVVEVTHREYRAGGAANVAMNVKTLGAAVETIGVCGEDAAGKKLREIFARQGIAYDPQFVNKNTPTILKERVVAGSGEHQLCRLDSEDIPAHYALKVQAQRELLQSKLTHTDVVIFSDYAKGVIDNSLLDFVATVARQRKILVLLDPKPKHELNFGGKVDVITPNRAEALQLAGMNPHETPFPAEKVCKKIHQLFSLKHLVITLSEDGLLISSPGAANQTIPTFAQRVCDVTGAGDTFVAALGCALGAGAPITQAAKFANLASGVVVGKPGTATVSPEEILEHQTIVPEHSGKLV